MADRKLIRPIFGVASHRGEMFYVTGAKTSHQTGPVVNTNKLRRIECISHKAIREKLIRICCVNPRSVKNKTISLCDCVLSIDFDMVAVTEM